MKKIVNICLLGFLFASSSVANEIVVTDQGKNDGNGGDQVYIDVQYVDDDNQPIANAMYNTLNLDSSDNFKITGFLRKDIGKYRLYLAHKCIKNKVYNETLELSVDSFDKENSNAYKQIPFTACEEENFRFQTDNPYSNNENITATITPKSISPSGKYAVIVKGETEQGYDYISLLSINTSNGALHKIATLDGKIDKKFLIKMQHPSVKITFSSDYSVTKEGVKVTILPVEETSD